VLNVVERDAGLCLLPITKDFASCIRATVLQLGAVTLLVSSLNAFTMFIFKHQSWFAADGRLFEVLFFELYIPIIDAIKQTCVRGLEKHLNLGR
jgi:uncharacterized membrane protein